MKLKMKGEQFNQIKFKFQLITHNSSHLKAIYRQLSDLTIQPTILVCA